MPWPRAASAARTSSSSAATRPRSSAPATPSSPTCSTRDWERNNILASLLCAREHLGAGFVSTYADIVYRGSAVKKAVASPHDKVLVNDTDWRRRYTFRTQHPETDAEKMRAEGERVVELSRKIESEKASGEFIGVTKFTPDGRARAGRRVRRGQGGLGGQDVARGAHLREGVPHRSRSRRCSSAARPSTASTPTAATWRSTRSRTWRAPRSGGRVRPRVTLAVG